MCLIAWYVLSRRWQLRTDRTYHSRAPCTQHSPDWRGSLLSERLAAHQCQHKVNSRDTIKCTHEGIHLAHHMHTPTQIRIVHWRSWQYCEQVTMNLSPYPQMIYFTLNHLSFEITWNILIAGQLTCPAIYNGSGQNTHPGVSMFPFSPSRMSLCGASICCLLGLLPTRVKSLQKQLLQLFYN